MTRYAKHIIRIFCLLAPLVLATSCSTTKLVPDDDHLFIGLKEIKYDNYEKNDHFNATQAEVEAALATEPNGALFGSPYYRTPFPYGLWIWNYAYGSSGKFKQWLLRSFGKPPVLMSQVNPALRASVAQSVLRKKGYMHGSVTYEEVPQKNPKKMKIAYTVNMDTLFIVDTLTYVNFPTQMQALIDSTRDDANIKPGDPFDVSELDAERTRISELFRNNGYYYYQPSFATYLADTLAVPNHANLRLQLADSLPSEVLHPWYVGNLKLNLQRFAREQMTDSIDRKILKVFWSGGRKRAPISPRVIMRDIKLRPRRAFSYDNYVESVQKINATGVFSSVDLAFTPRDRDTLDLTLNCIFDKPYDFYVETNIINRTIGRMGPELKLGITRRNAFRRGEKLDINLHGSYQWQTHGEDNESTYQYGLDASIEFPRILAPFVSDRLKRDKEGKVKRPRQFFSTPWTIAKISTDIINRPSYYKMHIVSGEWTYRWQPSENTQHEFSPITVNYQFVNSYTDKFIEAMRKNLILASSLRDQFIPKMRYTYIYNSPREMQSPIRWETTLEEAGNVTALYDVLIQGHGWNDKEKTLFKNPYSQFVRLETDLTKTWTLDSKSKLVGHINAGILWSYGNSDSAPFSESFYVGGANSIRAFPVRNIGPGSFPMITAKDAKQYTYLMQNGDSKLVLNLEYRRQLFGNLYGAIFLDAGNVWLSKDYDLTEEEIKSATNEEERQSLQKWNEYFSDNRFRFSGFFNRLATGTGIGLRYDLGFLIVRVDWGIALHHPGYTGKSGYFNISGFKNMNTVHLAIGYPF